MRTIKGNAVLGNLKQIEVTCCAWMAAWAEAGQQKDGKWTKAEHRQFEPAAVRVRELKLLVEEVQRN